MKEKEEIRNLPDEDIIELINKGSTNAFKHLVDRYQDNVASIVIGMLGYGPDLEDVGQEIFISVYKSLKNFRFRSTFKTYLTRIAINACLGEIKKKKRRMIFSSCEEGFKESGSENGGSDYEIRDSISRALQELDSKQRIVVVLRMMEGYSTKETSMILDIPEGTVLSRLSRAQKKLRDSLSHLVE